MIVCNLIKIKSSESALYIIRQPNRIENRIIYKKLYNIDYGWSRLSYVCMRILVSNIFIERSLKHVYKSTCSSLVWSCPGPNRQSYSQVYGPTTAEHIVTVVTSIIINLYEHKIICDYFTFRGSIRRPFKRLNDIKQVSS